MAWKILCCVLALVALSDAGFALAEFNHFGDLHIGWAGNSFIAALFWLFIGFGPKPTRS